MLLLTQILGPLTAMRHSATELTVFDKVAQFSLTLDPMDIPASTLSRGALMLLDTLGICAAAGPMEAGVLGRQAATLLYASCEPDHSARMLFDGRSVSLAGAVFAAATQLDNLDGHDGYNPTKGHIGVVAVPTLAVLAQHLPELTGPGALAAMIVGYEVAGRAATALHATVSDYHTSGAWNALGVAAMAARLRGQTPAMLRESFGIAEYHGPRSQMMREIANPTMLHDGSGWGALAGMSAAILAENGFTGAPAVTIEAAEAASHWADLGHFWQIEHQYVKPYPICRWAHAAIDAARELAQTRGFTAADIATVKIRSFDYAVQLFPGMPDTTSKAQYSLPFAVATMLVHGHIGLEHISGNGLQDPQVAAMVKRIEMQAEPRHEARYPKGRWADLEITLTDGRVLPSGDTHARGGPERPFGRDEIIAKYLRFAVPVLGETRAKGLCSAVLGLTQQGSSFADVAQYLYDPV